MQEGKKIIIIIVIIMYLIKESTTFLTIVVISELANLYVSFVYLYVSCSKHIYHFRFWGLKYDIFNIQIPRNFQS